MEVSTGWKSILALQTTGNKKNENNNFPYLRIMLNGFIKRNWQGFQHGMILFWI